MLRIRQELTLGWKAVLSLPLEEKTIQHHDKIIRPCGQDKGYNHKFFCMQNTNPHSAPERGYLNNNQNATAFDYGYSSVHHMVFIKQELSTII